MYAMYQWINVYSVGLNVMYELIHERMHAMYAEAPMQCINVYIWVSGGGVSARVGEWVRVCAISQCVSIFQKLKYRKYIEHTLTHTHGHTATSIQARAWRHAHAKLIIYT